MDDYDRPHQRRPRDASWIPVDVKAVLNTSGEVMSIYMTKTVAMTLISLIILWLSNECCVGLSHTNTTSNVTER